MAEVKLPDPNLRKQITNDAGLGRTVNYDVTGGKKEKTGTAKVWYDVKQSLKQEIVMPMLHNMLYQLIERAARMGLDSFFGERLGGAGYSGSSFSSNTFNAGFMGNRNYNPGTMNRFNQNNSWSRNPAPQAQQQANNVTTDWRFGRYYTKVDALSDIDLMKRYIDARGRLSVYKYCELRGVKCDWSLHNYGWTNFDDAYPHYVYDGYHDANGRSMPFEIVPPEPEYLGEFVND